MLSPIATRIEHASSIIIAKTFRGTMGGEHSHHFQHLAQYDIERLGHLHVIARGQRSRVKKEIQRIHVIVERLLEVDAIWPNLMLCFRQDN